MKPKSLDLVLWEWALDDLVKILSEIGWTFGIENFEDMIQPKLFNSVIKFQKLQEVELSLPDEISRW